MIRKLLSLSVVMTGLALAGCGSGEGTIASPPTGGGGGPGPGEPVPTTLQLLASSPQLPSDRTGVNKVTLTALVRDASNVVMPEVLVSFSATSGALSVIQPFTDSSGAAIAELTNGVDPTNRTITVSALVEGITSQIAINVVGTTLTVTGPGALALGDSGSYTIVLRDSNGAGITGQTVAVSSNNGNMVSSSSLVTAGGGDVQVTLTATNGGNDTLSATVLGLTGTRPVSVSSDSFVFATPASGTELDIGGAPGTPVSVQWTKAGVPQAGETISFTSTRGTLSAGSAVTNAAGIATVNVFSSSAGPAVLSATNPESTSTTRSVEFVATVADSLILQASPFNLAIGQQSSLTATVRDPSGNLVKNKTVVFELTDVTGGFLSLATDVTDSQGRAQTFYTAGQSASQPGGVQIRAFVQDTPAVEGTVALTVAQQALSIALGTGNDLFEIGTATFAKEWVVIVTDSIGNAIANKDVQVSVNSLDYYLGSLVVSGNNWIRPQLAPGINPLPGTFLLSQTLRCANEDPGNTGVVPPFPQDFNNNGRIEPGNIAAVAAVPADAPLGNPCGSAGTQGQAASVITNNQGLARVCVFYPQNYNLWLDVRIEAKASVTGTEFSRAQAFLLPGLAADLSNVNASPPGVVSPFGPVTSEGCATPPPGT